MLETFSLETLSISIVSVVGAIGLCMRGSKCSVIKTPCCQIERVVNDIEQPNIKEEGI